MAVLVEAAVQVQEEKVLGAAEADGVATEPLVVRQRRVERRPALGIVGLGELAGLDGDRHLCPAAVAQLKPPADPGLDIAEASRDGLRVDGQDIRARRALRAHATNLHSRVRLSTPVRTAAAHSPISESHPP